VSRVGRLDNRLKVIAGLALVALVLVVSYLAGVEASAANLMALGYPGVFLISMLAGGSMVFPVPSQAAIIAAGAVLNPLLVGLAAGLGNSVGEFTGYLAGYGGREALSGARSGARWQQVEGWLRRNGFLGLVLFAAIPNPIFDIAGVLAGSMGYSPRRFWLACAIGNTIKYTALAYLGEAALVHFFGMPKLGL
jgi:membrane protein YqaA with SNARE-associated domain